jgi:hypothetical protein
MITSGQLPFLGLSAVKEFADDVHAQTARSAVRELVIRSAKVHPVQNRF